MLRRVTSKTRTRAAAGPRFCKNCFTDILSTSSAPVSWFAKMLGTADTGAS